MAHTILIVEDDQPLARQVAGLLSRYGYVAHVADDLSAIDREAERLSPDLILLDVNLPFFDGFWWCRRLREVTRVPILMVSARDAASDQVRGMEAGADDYVTKPFDPDVLLAKINAAIRRSYGELRDEGASEEVIARQGVEFRQRRLTVTYGSSSVELSVAEAELFRLLLSACPDAVSRSELLVAAWDDDAFVEDNTLSVNIGRIRAKLAQVGIPAEVRTVRSFGYQLVVTGQGARP